MVSTNNLFDRDLRIATADLEPDEIKAALVKFAKQSLADAIASGAASPIYDTYVNGRKGAQEESVVPPGPIVYVFSNWKLVIDQAMKELQKRAPTAKTGRYAASFIVIVDNKVVTDYSAIAPTAEVIITNFQPYVRKVETGVIKSGRRNFDLSKVALNRRFGGVFRTDTMFLDIKSGVHPQIPYVLKNSQGRRKRRQAGDPLTYPALVINAV